MALMQPAKTWPKWQQPKRAISLRLVLVTGHPHGGHFAASTAFPNWIGGNPDGDDTSAPPTPAGRTLGQRGGNPPDELSPPAMLGSPLSRQTGRRAEAQLLNGHTSPLPWNAHTTPAGTAMDHCSVILCVEHPA